METTCSTSVTWMGTNLENSPLCYIQQQVQITRRTVWVWIFVSRKKRAFWGLELLKLPFNSIGMRNVACIITEGSSFHSKRSMMRLTGYFKSSCSELLYRLREESPKESSTVPVIPLVDDAAPSLSIIMNFIFMDEQTQLASPELYLYIRPHT